jgi:hypothetical protein
MRAIKRKKMMIKIPHAILVFAFGFSDMKTELNV